MNLMKPWLFFAIAVLSSATARSQSSAHSSEDLKTLPVLWHQSAAEYRALCYQAYNLAALRLNAIPTGEVKAGKLAIITDLDETALDNSPSEAKLIADGKEYTSASWRDWVSRSAATEVPGAVAFFKKASAMGFHIFYISNRDTAARDATLENMRKIGLPQAELPHLLFYSGNASKEPRRQEVGAHYSVVMLLGDNLADFTSAFENKSIADRFKETDRAHDEWGKKFIVLPNAIYGDWESAFYQYKRLSPAQKDSARRSLLRSY